MHTEVPCKIPCNPAQFCQNRSLDATVSYAGKFSKEVNFVFDQFCVHIPLVNSTYYLLLYVPVTLYVFTKLSLSQRYELTLSPEGVIFVCLTLPLLPPLPLEMGGSLSWTEILRQWGLAWKFKSKLTSVHWGIPWELQNVIIQCVRGTLRVRESIQSSIMHCSARHLQLMLAMQCSSVHYTVLSFISVLSS